MGWEVGGRLKREETYGYLRLIHADVWQKPIPYCRAIIQLKINNYTHIYINSEPKEDVTTPRWCYISYPSIMLPNFRVIHLLNIFYSSFNNSNDSSVSLFIRHSEKYWQTPDSALPISYHNERPSKYLSNGISKNIS